MVDDATRHAAPTRRDYMKYGGTVAVGGFLAGCTGGEGTDSEPEPTPEDTETSSSDQTKTETEEPSYEVCMEPVGCLEFEEPPEKWFPFTADYADMGVALGQTDGLSAIGLRARYPTYYYDELPGVSVNKENLIQLWQDGVDKELFYELDADVHIIDPNFAIQRLGWSENDVKEITENVAPFFGNTGFSQVYEWHDYRYYSMYEALEKLAELFQERDRYEAFASYHDEVLDTVQSRLPEESSAVAVLVPGGIPPESFWPYLIEDGTTSKHWRDLKVTDALGMHDVPDAQVSGETIDYELLLERTVRANASRTARQRSVSVVPVVVT